MHATRNPHPLVELIKTYYEGCNTADEALMMSTFAPEVVHYFVDHSAVRGAVQLANYWAKVGPATQAHWLVDNALINEPEGVIEWSMRWVPPATGQPELLRGTEWFVFAEGKIAEIRSYHNNYYLHDTQFAGLQDFDYVGRGYRTL
ncbi:MAG: nuclear transport factor 2 family protein [Pseudomonadota bacterium]